MAAVKTSGKARTPAPVALTGAEVAILAAVLGGAAKSVGDVSVKGAEALVAYFRKEGPIAHRILASWKEDDDHCVALELINVTLHGGYVEKLEVSKPSSNFDFQAAFPKRPEKPMGLGETRRSPIAWKKQTDIFPIYVAPAASVGVFLRLKDDVARTLAKTQ